ncbi:hypothetical protein NM208_g5523 [Fusarium decemcellulare]|uniref:Uncharacterized protein n=1 Tax=Fusarium decemcellulare TaxID=57161 RepID=A0ACC1SGR7_9HYPO|nr:hypothetical protein NM208_g5523 [Fusarium decemcellulare]
MVRLESSQCQHCYCFRLLRDVPGQFPSGGLVRHNLDIYRLNAPDVEFYAPDIYLQNHGKICDCFSDGKQPLSIPEPRQNDYGLRRMWSAFGNYQAIVSSPFGIDSIAPKACTLALRYGLIDKVQNYILDTHANCPEDIMGLYFDERDSSKADPTRSRTLGDYHLTIERAFVFGNSGTAAGLIISQPGDRYLLVGYDFPVAFKSTNPRPTFTGILKADALDEDGKNGLRRIRSLNGDETQYGETLGLPVQNPDYDGFPIPSLVPAGTMIVECVPYSIEETGEDF